MKGTNRHLLPLPSRRATNSAATPKARGRKLNPIICQVTSAGMVIPPLFSVSSPWQDDHGDGDAAGLGIPLNMGNHFRMQVAAPSYSQARGLARRRGTSGPSTGAWKAPICIRRGAGALRCYPRLAARRRSGHRGRRLTKHHGVGRRHRPYSRCSYRNSNSGPKNSHLPFPSSSTTARSMMPSSRTLWSVSEREMFTSSRNKSL